MQWLLRWTLIRASAVRTRLQPNIFFFFFFFFSFSIRNIFFPFITTLKIHISYKISSVSPNCYFFYFFFIFLFFCFWFVCCCCCCLFFLLFLFYFSPTVSIRIFISEMMFSRYLSMLVILKLLSLFATFRM